MATSAKEVNELGNALERTSKSATKTSDAIKQMQQDIAQMGASVSQAIANMSALTEHERNTRTESRETYVMQVRGAKEAEKAYKELSDQYVETAKKLEELLRKQKTGATKTGKPLAQNTIDRLPKQIETARKKLQELDIQISQLGGGKFTTSFNAIKRSFRDVVKETKEVVPAWRQALDAMTSETSKTSQVIAKKLIDKEKVKQETLDAYREARQAVVSVYGTNANSPTRLLPREERYSYYTESGAQEYYRDEMSKRIQDATDAQQKYNKALKETENLRKRQEQINKRNTAAQNAIKDYEKLTKELQRLESMYQRLQGRRLAGTMSEDQFKKYEQSLLNQYNKLKAEQQRYEQASVSLHQRSEEQKRAETKKTEDTVQGSYNKLHQLASRLGAALGVSFSVRGLTGFVRKMVEVRGEFQMQQVALRQILSNKEKADEIWQKTLNAALQSPLTAMQLTRYTKQLAAYRIETDKLFDTTKRLADVSAGLGVDMGRLILAYGQVKTANFLRASEVRQFTEAGVNIYGELATYFSEITGKTHEVADIVDMVSKRKVLFEDVEAVFQRITDKGGVFYEMQLVQSETVKGQVNKLKDAYDQMLNTIGEANEGAIKNVISSLLSMVRNWREFAGTVKSIGLGALTFWLSKAAAALGLFGAKAKAAALEAKFGTKAIKKLSVSIKELTASLLANPLTAILAATTILVAKIVELAKAQREYNNEIDKQNLALYDTSQKYKDYQSRIDANNDALKTAAKNSEEYKKAQSDNALIMSELKRDYPQIANGMKQLADNTIDYGNALQVANDNLERQMYLQASMKQKQSGFLWGIFEDATGKDIKEFSEGIAEQRVGIINAQTAARKDLMNLETERRNLTNAGNTKGLEKLNEEAAAYEEFYKKIISLDPSKVRESMAELRKAYDELWKVTDGFNVKREWNKSVRDTDWKVENVYKQITNLPHDYSEFYRELNKQKEVWIHDIGEAIMQVPEYAKEVEDEYGGDWRTFIAANFSRIQQDIKDGRNTGYASLKAALEQYAPDKETQTALNNFLFNNIMSEADVDVAAKALAKRMAKAGDDIQELEKKYIDKFMQMQGLQLQYILETSKDRQTQIGKEAIASIEKQLNELRDELSKELLSFDIFESATSTDNARKPTSGAGDKANEVWRKRIKLIQDMNKQYKNLAKNAYSAAKSERKVREDFQSAWAEVFKGININMDDVNFMSEKGVADALEKLRGQIPEKLRAELEKDIADYRVKVDMEIESIKRNEFKEKMEQMFSDYQMTLEIQNLGLSDDAASQLISTYKKTTLADIANAANEFRNQIMNAAGGDKSNFDEEDSKLYRQYLSKINAEYLKKEKEDANRYTKFLANELSERAKLELQYQQDLMYIRSHFSEEEDAARRTTMEANITKKYNEEVAKLEWKTFKESDFYVDMMQDLSDTTTHGLDLLIGELDKWVEKASVLSPRALKEVLNARQKAIEAQVALNPFGTVATMFKGLKEVASKEEYANDGGLFGTKKSITGYVQLKKAVNDYLSTKKAEAANIDREIDGYDEQLGALKALEEAYKKLAEGESLSAKALSKGENGNWIFGDAVNYKNMSEEQIDAFLENYRAAIKDQLEKKPLVKDFGGETEEYKKELNNWQNLLTVLQNVVVTLNAYKKAGKSLPEGWDKDSGSALSILSGLITTTETDRGNAVKKKNALEKSINDATKDAQKLAELDLGVKKLSSDITATGSAVKNFGNAFYDMFDALGGETDVVTEQWKEFGGTLIDTITQSLAMIPMLISGFTSAGVAIDSAMGIIGLVAEAVQLTMTLVTSIAKLHDSYYERTIQREQEKIERLTKAYEKLEKAMDRTLSMAEYALTYDEMNANLDEQEAAIKRQMQAERDKKNTDKEKLKEYEEQLEEVQEKREEMQKNATEEFGGIGVDNYRSAAQEFVDAWTEAFNETGDGLQGLKDHFDGFLQDWFKKQATMRGASKILEPLFKAIDNAVDGNNRGGFAVTADELNEIRGVSETVFANMDNFMQTLADVWGGLGGEGTLSGLAAGIQGMTEEQAEVLAAYWNSCRMYVANMDTNVARIATLLEGQYGGGTISTNPMLEQMRLVAQNTSNIQQLLNNVSDGGHSRGGRGIKVFVS